MKQTLAMALLAGIAFVGPAAHAGYVVTLTQVGDSVVATGSGTIDLSGLTFLESTGGGVVIEPSRGTISLGPTGVSSDDVYTGFTGPTSFGSGFGAVASSGSGDFVGISYNLGEIGVPEGYVSGSSLSDTATWDDATFASLGVTPGTYVWTWGTAAADDIDTFTLDVVPEPGSLALLGTALIGIGAFGFNRRRRD